MPTHFTNGVSNVVVGNPLYEYPYVDPTTYYTYFNDFFIYTAGDWTETATSAGAGTSAWLSSLLNAGGSIDMLSAANDNDGSYLQLLGEGFVPVANRKMFFRTRFKGVEATQSDMVAGIQITDTTPQAVSDGVFFRKDDGDALIDLVIVAAAAGTTTVTGIATLVDDTFITLAFYYDGIDTITYYVNDVRAGETVSTNLPLVPMTVSFGMVNGEAGAVVGMSMDHILAAIER